MRGNLIMHPDGSAHFYDIEPFTGTVNGVSGIVTFSLSGTGSSTGGYQGPAVIVNGTGALANLHGVLHQVGTAPDKPTGPLGASTGKIHPRGDGRDDEPTRASSSRRTAASCGRSLAMPGSKGSGPLGS